MDVRLVLMMLDVYSGCEISVDGVVCVQCRAEN